MDSELTLTQQIALWHKLHMWAGTTIVWEQFRHCSLSDAENGIRYAAQRWAVGQLLSWALGAQTVTNIVQ